MCATTIQKATIQKEPVQKEPAQGAAVPPPTDPNPIFTRIQLTGAAPNADNAYLGVWIPAPAAGQVVVIKGRAPSAATGNDPALWPDQRHDVRYFSMCVNLAEPNAPVVVNTAADGTLDYGCRYDDNTKLDLTGYYTYVVGTEAQRAQIEATPGVTFLPLSASQPTAPHLLLLRNLLPVDAFTKSVQSVPVGSTPAQANAVMGGYYPQVTTRTLASLR
jgi:hypothetical protein